MAAATNSKIFLAIVEEKKQQHKQINRRCSLCGKKLKNLKRRTTSQNNPLSCWQCMILNNSNADS
jgi:hypothetical protein